MARLRTPAIVAHRGKHDVAPENSMAALRAALDVGADALEIDVHTTCDGVVVVHHDPVLAAAPRGGHGAPIADLTLEQLATCHLADGSSIPLLDEVLALAAGRAHVHVEIKAKGIERAVLNCITRSSTSASVHSFDHRIVRQCGELNPGVRRGILLESYLVDTVGAMRAAAAADVWQQYELIDEDLVREVQTVGGRVVAWTVNDHARAIALADVGVDAICTDDIAGIREALAAA